MSGKDGYSEIFLRKEWNKNTKIMKILLGTNNQNKIMQFRRIFKNFGSEIELVTLIDAKITDDIEEDADNLIDNAKKKARFYGQKSGMISLADDTGLFVDALSGEPGVHAKRWCEGTDEDRYMKILDRMKNILEKDRTCRYTGVLAIYYPKTNEFWTYQNDIEGKIARIPHTKNGFGYDPIFISVKFDKYYSELSDSERDSISHRGMGIKDFLERE